ncbi:MAG: hypothetical protein RL480_816, partial [Pseudomonadota bacterium]
MDAINYLKLFLFASTAMTQTAQAQTAAGNASGPAPQAESPTVEADIVVTAQRREERLLDVPIAVSVINPALMERAGFQNINNMQAFVPNLQINQTVGNSFSPLITIRGLSPSSDTSLARDQPVGIYLDGVPIAKSTGSAFDTVELARVEVLRGPQGTLYGKNTIGGAVNLVSAEPTGEFGGTAWLSYGQWDRVQSRVSLNLPTVANFKVKLSYSGNNSGGYWRNAAINRDFGSQSLIAGRADVLWEPSSNFSARYTYDISDAKGRPTMLAINSIASTFPASLRPLIAGEVFTDRPGRDDVAAQSAL